MEAIVHNSNQRRCGRVLMKFPEIKITSRLSAIPDRFATALDCVDIGLIADDQIVDQLPSPPSLASLRLAAST